MNMINLESNLLDKSTSNNNNIAYNRNDSTYNLYNNNYNNISENHTADELYRNDDPICIYNSEINKQKTNTDTNSQVLLKNRPTKYFTYNNNKNINFKDMNSSLKFRQPNKKINPFFNTKNNKTSTNNNETNLVVGINESFKDTMNIVPAIKFETIDSGIYNQQKRPGSEYLKKYKSEEVTKYLHRTKKNNEQYKQPILPTRNEPINLKYTNLNHHQTDDFNTNNNLIDNNKRKNNNYKNQIIKETMQTTINANKEVKQKFSLSKAQHKATVKKLCKGNVLKRKPSDNNNKKNNKHVKKFSINGTKIGGTTVGSIDDQDKEANN